MMRWTSATSGRNIIASVAFSSSPVGGPVTRTKDSLPQSQLGRGLRSDTMHHVVRREAAEHAFNGSQHLAEVLLMEANMPRATVIPSFNMLSLGSRPHDGYSLAASRWRRSLADSSPTNMARS